MKNQEAVQSEAIRKQAIAQQGIEADFEGKKWPQGKFFFQLQGCWLSGAAGFGWSSGNNPHLPGTIDEQGISAGQRDDEHFIPTLVPEILFETGEAFGYFFGNNQAGVNVFAPAGRKHE